MKHFVAIVMIITDKDNTPVAFQFKTVKLKGTIGTHGTFYTVQYTINIGTTSPVELLVQLPHSPDVDVCGVTIENGNTLVKCEIDEKKTAENKYDDAIAEGSKTAVLVTRKQYQRDCLELRFFSHPDLETKLTLQCFSEQQRIGSF